MWLVDGLMEAGYAVKLVNTLAVQQYDGLKYQNDHTDVFHLALSVKANTLKQWAKTVLTEFDLNPKLRLALQCNLTVIRVMNEQLDIVSTLAVDMMILLETGDLNRLSKVDQYASYCRCVYSCKVK